MRVRRLVVLMAAVAVGIALAAIVWCVVQNVRGNATQVRLDMLGEKIAIRALYLEPAPLGLPEGDVASLREWMDLRGDAGWLGLTTSVVTGERLPLVDFWGRPLVYRYPSRRAEAIFDLYSVGPNGVDEQGEGDDITCGEAAEFSSYSSAFKEGIVDVEWIRAQKGHLQRERQGGKIIGAPPSRFSSDSGQVPRN